MAFCEMEYDYLIEKDKEIVHNEKDKKRIREHRLQNEGRSTVQYNNYTEARRELKRQGLRMTGQRHFVLVHGACHGAWCWYKVAALLKSAGHKVTALDLAASGVHPKQVQDLQSITDYFQPLMEFMMSLEPDERVILVGHSMGGLSISVAMERFPEKVAAGVFASAVMPGPNYSYTTVREEYARRISFMDSVYMYHNGPNSPATALLFGPNLMATKLYQLSSAEDLELGMSLLRPIRSFSNEAIQEKEMLTKEKYGSVARVYVVCDQDNIVKEDLQRWMIENNPPDEVKVISGSDHMVMLCKPLELCSSLEEIGEKYI